MRQNKGIWIDVSDRERFCADAKAFLRPRGRPRAILCGRQSVFEAQGASEVCLVRQNKGIRINFSDRERFCADAKAFLKPMGRPRAILCDGQSVFEGGTLGTLFRGGLIFMFWGASPECSQAVFLNAIQLSFWIRAPRGIF